MLDYAKVLNPAQYAAVTSEDQSVLVVAGAGSGKTRTIVHRLAWLMEKGVDPTSVLLLTFTRKAAGEMLARAATLLGYDPHGISGGTFHSFAYGALRRFPPSWLEGRPFTLMDGQDITMAIKHCREALKAGKGDSSFPKNQTIANIISKGRNKQLPVDEILRMDSFHLLPHAQAIAEIGCAYGDYKRQKALLDYDDLLFELENLLKSDSSRADGLRSRFRHILVDEYQDTNIVQASIVRQLTMPGEDGSRASVMAVGDEAQSIYAFRGANVRNILDFQKTFPDARVIALEENYRSTQPILDVANHILDSAAQSFRKHLFTRSSGGELPRLVTPISDLTEARVVTARIDELLSEYQPNEIAVLFRAGYHSYPLENALRQARIPFRKYGGARFVEAAHIKDVLAFARLTLNPLDLPAFERIAAMHKGIGPKTTASLHTAVLANDQARLEKAFKRFPAFLDDIRVVDNLRAQNLPPTEFFEQVLDYYQLRFEKLYPEDWPSRAQGLEEILRMAAPYAALDNFLADMALETADDTVEDNCLTLSTIHSAKGLEWSCVLVLDMVEDRFPSRHAQSKPEDFEEERRLFYVACTRAKEKLEIYAPATIYSRDGHGASLVSQSPFLCELPRRLFNASMERSGGVILPDVRFEEPRQSPQVKAEGDGRLQMKARQTAAASHSQKNMKNGNTDAAYCRHRIFGRGKIVKWLGTDKAQVDFPGFGLKTILADYLLPED